MIRKIFCFFMTAGILFSVPLQTVAQEEGGELPQVTAESAILMDAATGEILFQKNSEKQQYPASITKLMTMLLAMEYGNFDEVMTFSKEAVFGIERNSSHIAIDVGEQITLEQGLYAIMLQSANEVSLGVAEQIDGSVEAFAAHMTQKAKELGCKNTNFVNANGLHDENHVTTAYDMALITKAVMQYPKFRKIAATTYYELPPTNKQPEIRYLYGQHQMLKKSSKFYYPDCLGGKTGFTNEAQHTLVTFAKRGETELIAVVLNDAGTETYSDTIRLFDYGFSNFQTVRAFSAKNYQTTTEVLQNGKNSGEIAELSPQSDCFLTLKLSQNPSQLEIAMHAPETVEAPVTAGQAYGTVQVLYQGSLVAEEDLIAKTSVFAVPTTQNSNKISFSMENLGKSSILAGGAMVAFFTFLMYLKQKRRARRRRKTALRYHKRLDARKRRGYRTVRDIKR